MPRNHVDPIVPAMRCLEECPLEAIPSNLAVLKEIARRRLNGETVLTEAGPRIDTPPKRTRRAKPPVAPAQEG